MPGGNYNKQSKYKTKKMSEDAVGFKAHRAALQAAYRMRKKQNQTLREERQQRRKERDRKRRQRKSRNAIACHTHFNEVTP